jgi:hypothetical protein
MRRGLMRRNLMKRDPMRRDREGVRAPVAIMVRNAG